MKTIKQHWKDILIGVLFALILLIAIKYKKEFIKKEYNIYKITSVKSYERMWEYNYLDSNKVKSEFRFGNKKYTGDTLMIK